MHMPPLWRPRAMRRLGGQGVALENDYLIKEVGDRRRGGKAAHSRADHDGLLSYQS